MAGSRKRTAPGSAGRLGSKLTLDNVADSTYRKRQLPATAGSESGPAPHGASLAHLTGERRRRHRLTIEQKLAVVECAKKAFGRAEALAVWRTMALPSIGAPAPPPETAPHQLIRQFMADQVIASKGDQVQAVHLYAAYRDWAIAHDHRPVTIHAFGICLRDIGLRKRRSRFIHYLDIKLQN